MSASAAPTGPSRRPLLGRLVPAICLLIALGLAYAAYDNIREHRAMAHAGVAVEGSMTGGYRQITTGRARATSYHPTFSYRIPDGRVIIGTVPDSMSQSEIRLGATAALRYDPRDPHTVRLASALAAGPGVMPWVLCGVALVMAATFAVWLVRAVRAGA